MYYIWANQIWEECENPANNAHEAFRYRFNWHVLKFSFNILFLRQAARHFLWRYQQNEPTPSSFWVKQKYFKNIFKLKIPQNL